MSWLTRDGTTEPVSRDQILRHVQGQGTNHFPRSADHEQDWQPYPVDPYSAICDDYTYSRSNAFRYENKQEIIPSESNSRNPPYIVKKDLLVSIGLSSGLSP